MRKEAIVLWTLPFVMTFVGLFAGFYFGVYRTSVATVACELSKSLIAPSPIVTNSRYDEKNKELELTVKNPGGMPILLIDKTLALVPADKTKAPEVIMTSIPLGLTVPPYSDVTFKLKLGKAGSGFNVGDVLQVGLTYSLPVSNDVYSLVHIFKKSSKTDAQGYVVNQQGNNQAKLDAYQKEVKAEQKK